MAKGTQWVFYYIFFKQVSLHWLSLRAKKLHSSSPTTSKLSSVNPRASSNLGSGIICSDPQGQLRSVYTGSGCGMGESQNWGSWRPCAHTSTQPVKASPHQPLWPSWPPTCMRGQYFHYLLRGSVAKLLRTWALEPDCPRLPLTSYMTLSKLLTSLWKANLLLSSNQNLTAWSNDPGLPMVLWVRNLNRAQPEELVSGPHGIDYGNPTGLEHPKWPYSHDWGPVAAIGWGTSARC